MRAKQLELKVMHAQVRGTGKGCFDGERYSALDPELWKWVGTSSANVFYAGYLAIYGRDFDDAQRETVWRTIRTLLDLSLSSGRADVPHSVSELQAYYDEVAATKLAANPFLEWAAGEFEKLPVPGFVRSRWVRLVVTPGWRLLLVPLTARISRVCAQQAAHPKMLELLDRTPTRVHNAEFAAYRIAVRNARRRMPKWLMLEPLAYNRYRYEELREAHSRHQLSSFAPPEMPETAHAGGPMRLAKPWSRWSHHRGGRQHPPGALPRGLG